MLEGLRKPTELVVVVRTLLAYGCPLQAIVPAFGLDERRVARWRDRAGHHCQRLHQAVVEQASLDLLHVQADEIRVKGRRITVGMGLALMVSTRRWLAGVVSLTRETRLADRMLAQVRRCAAAVRPLLVCTDGWAASPGSIQRAFREKVKRTVGPGRSRLLAWPDRLIATGITPTKQKRVVAITRRMTQGTIERAQELLSQSKGGSVLNTAFRERLATLTRRCRPAAHRLEALETGMDLIGGVSNVCVVHDELSSSQHFGAPTPPAMAAGLTAHRWSVKPVLLFQVAPAAWGEPKRRGRPRLGAPVRRPSISKRPGHLRPLLRLRKGAFRAVTG